MYYKTKFLLSNMHFNFLTESRKDDNQTRFHLIKCLLWIWSKVHFCFCSVRLKNVFFFFTIWKSSHLCWSPLKSKRNQWPNIESMHLRRFNIMFTMSLHVVYFLDFFPFLKLIKRLILNYFIGPTMINTSFNEQCI